MLRTVLLLVVQYTYTTQEVSRYHQYLWSSTSTSNTDRRVTASTSQKSYRVPSVCRGGRKEGRYLSLIVISEI